jgi:hypothetical protein
MAENRWCADMWRPASHSPRKRRSEPATTFPEALGSERKCIKKRLKTRRGFDVRAGAAAPKYLPPSQTRTSSQRRRMIKFGADGKTPPAHVSSSFLPFASLMCSFDAKTRCGTTAIRLFKKQWLFLFRFRTNLSIVSRNKACL